MTDEPDAGVFQVWRETFTDSNILTVETGTNCPCGGDAGYGGATTISFIDDGGTAMFCALDGEENLTGVRSVQIMFRGDAECRTLIEALAFALRTLRRQVKENTEEATSDRRQELSA